MDNKKSIFDKITDAVGCVFFGTWGIASVYYFCKQVIEFIFGK